uniref:Dystroglycan n=1 Tax=Panagrellus redivivus TaxID=6233 RepID=A0A7E4V4N6_PANRE
MLSSSTILTTTPISTSLPTSNFTSISLSASKSTITVPVLNSTSISQPTISTTSASSNTSTVAPTTANSSTTALPTTAAPSTNSTKRAQSKTALPTVSTTITLPTTSTTAPSTPSTTGTPSTTEMLTTTTSTAPPLTSTTLAPSTTSTTPPTTTPSTTSTTKAPSTTSATTAKPTTTVPPLTSTTLAPPSISTRSTPSTTTIYKSITEDNITISNTNITSITAADNLTEPDMPNLTPANAEVIENVVEIYRYMPRDCCITLPVATVTLVVFVLIVATIIAIWLICVAFLRRREKIYCMESLQKITDDMYRNGKPSKQGGQFMPGPVVMTPEFKMEQFLKNMQNKPAPITTDEKCIGGVLNFLAHNPIEDEVIYRPGRQDVVLEPRDLPFKGSAKTVPTHHNALPESEVASIPEKHRSKHHRNGVEIDSENEPVLFGGRDLNHTKSAPRKIKKENMNALKRTFKKKRSKKPRKPTPAGILPPPKSPATTPPQPTSPNPYRSKDRVVYKDGTHYRA